MASSDTIACWLLRCRLTERARGVFDREVLSSSKAFVTRVPYEFLKLAICAGSSVEQCRATLEVRAGGDCRAGCCRAGDSGHTLSMLLTVLPACI
jgi:hypothetical protein